MERTKAVLEANAVLRPEMETAIDEEIVVAKDTSGEPGSNIAKVDKAWSEEMREFMASYDKLMTRLGVTVDIAKELASLERINDKDMNELKKMIKFQMKGENNLPKAVFGKVEDNAQKENNFVKFVESDRGHALMQNGMQAITGMNESRGEQDIKDKLIELAKQIAKRMLDVPPPWMNDFFSWKNPTLYRLTG